MGKKLHPLQYELEQFLDYTSWLDLISGKKIKVTLLVDCAEEDQIINVPFYMLKICLQKLRVKTNNCLEVKLHISVTDQNIFFRWVVQPALSEDFLSGRELRSLLKIWSSQLESEVVFQLKQVTGYTDFEISWMLHKDNV